MSVSVATSFRGRVADPLARTSLGLASSTLISAALGVGFWTLAARLFSAREVGRDSALVAALLAMAGIGQLNLNNVFPRFLPQVVARRGRYVSLGYACSALFSALLGLGFVLIAPAISGSFGFLQTSGWLIVLFPLSVAAWAIFSLQDAVITALGKAAWLPVENGLFSVARVAILPLGLIGTIGHPVFIAFVVPMFGAVAVTNWFIVNRGLPAAASTGRGLDALEVSRRALGGYLVKDFGATVLAQALMAAVPLVVLSTLGSSANAYFYVPFTLVVTFDSLFMSVSASLTTEAARDPASAGRLARKSIRWLIRIQLPVALLIIVAAPLVLMPYGHAYVSHGTTLLRLLTATSCFRSIAFLYGAIGRLQGKTGRLLGFQAVSAALVTGGVALLAGHSGLDGVGLAWFGAWGVLAVICLPRIRRFLRDANVWAAR